MTPICLDSSGWIEIAHDGANAAKFSQALTNPEALILSTISLYEIAKYTVRVADEAAAVALLDFLHQYQVIPVSSEIATLASRLGARHKLAMADALIYATATQQNATLWTQDDDFKDLPHVKYFQNFSEVGP